MAMQSSSSDSHTNDILLTHAKTQDIDNLKSESIRDIVIKTAQDVKEIKEHLLKCDIDILDHKVSLSGYIVDHK